VPPARRAEGDRADAGAIGSPALGACDCGTEPLSCGFLTEMASARSITALLTDWSRGDSTALEQLLPLVYDELRRIAARQLRGERVNHTLQPTALVHEVYLRLIDQRQVNWQDRAQFLGVAAQTMRRILVDHARRHGARKRGDGMQCVSIDDAKELAAPQNVPLLALDHALGRLEAVDNKLARIVELRAFGGLTIEEAAHVLNVSPSTVKRDWRTAKAWLNRELGANART
jgi:RNA polymerase sigma factor (TIGR02999 family)